MEQVKMSRAEEELQQIYGALGVKDLDGAILRIAELAENRETLIMIIDTFAELNEKLKDLQ